MSCSGCCQERLQKSDVDCWTSDIGQLMAAEAGREKFIKYLEDRDLDEALVTIGFVIHCDALLKRLEPNRYHRKHRERSNIQKLLSDLLEEAEKVNFYENEIEKLQEVLEEHNNDKICDTLRKAKGSALHLLQEEHTAFSKYLLKEFNSTCK